MFFLVWHLSSEELFACTEPSIAFTKAICQFAFKGQKGKQIKKCLYFCSGRPSLRPEQTLARTLDCRIILVNALNV